MIEMKGPIMLPNEVRDALRAVHRIYPKQEMGESLQRMIQIDAIVASAKVNYPDCFYTEVFSKSERGPVFAGKY